MGRDCISEGRWGVSLHDAESQLKNEHAHSKEKISASGLRSQLQLAVSMPNRTTGDGEDSTCHSICLQPIYLPEDCTSPAAY
jgi:hypothetical protein